MDDKFIYKIAKRGEGKTKWLLDIADKETSLGKEVYLLTNNPLQYRNFIEDFFSLYGRVCTVHHIGQISNAISGGIVLIDNLFNLNINLNEFNLLANICDAAYITLPGKKSCSYKKESANIYEQLTIDSLEVCD